MVPSGSDHCDHFITVDDIEGRSGLDFFHDLAIPLQDALEGKASDLVIELSCPST